MVLILIIEIINDELIMENRENSENGVKIEKIVKMDFCFVQIAHSQCYDRGE